MEHAVQYGVIQPGFCETEQKSLKNPYLSGRAEGVRPFCWVETKSIEDQEVKLLTKR